MHAAAESLEFEKAASLRDQIYEMRQILADMENVQPWDRARALAGDDRNRRPN
jgi:excinuclease ABC subunit B